jgi:hypothetical protein
MFFTSKNSILFTCPAEKKKREERHAQKKREKQAEKEEKLDHLKRRGSLFLDDEANAEVNLSALNTDAAGGRSKRKIIVVIVYRPMFENSVHTISVHTTLRMCVLILLVLVC